MNLQVAMQGGDRITKQRNLFLVITIALSITSGALSLKILAQEERIIMVPPLSSEVMISNRKVSSGYLEQMTMVFLNSLLDLSAADVLHKRDMILKYTSNSDQSFSKKINEYFADSLEKYKNLKPPFLDNPQVELMLKERLDNWNTKNPNNVNTKIAEIPQQRGNELKQKKKKHNDKKDDYTVKIFAKKLEKAE